MNEQSSSPQPAEGRNLHYSASDKSFHSSAEAKKLRKTTTKLNMILSDKALKWGLRKIHPQR